MTFPFLSTLVFFMDFVKIPLSGWSGSFRIPRALSGGSLVDITSLLGHVEARDDIQLEVGGGLHDLGCWFFLKNKCGDLSLPFVELFHFVDRHPLNKVIVVLVILIRVGAVSIEDKAFFT